MHKHDKAAIILKFFNYIKRKLVRILFCIMQEKLPFTPFDVENKGQHDHFSHSTRQGPVGIHLHHISFLYQIATEHATKRSISEVANLNFQK